MCLYNVIFTFPRRTVEACIPEHCLVCTSNRHYYKGQNVLGISTPDGQGIQYRQFVQLTFIFSVIVFLAKSTNASSSLVKELAAPALAVLILSTTCSIVVGAAEHHGNLRMIHDPSQRPLAKQDCAEPCLKFVGNLSTRDPPLMGSIMVIPIPLPVAYSRPLPA